MDGSDHDDGNPPQVCPQCGGERPPGFRVCPTCTLGAALEGFDEGVGRFQILGELGRGGEAVVYRARDPQRDRDVALKVLRRDLAKDEEFVQRFQRAVDLAGQIEHPNIIRAYDRSRPGDVPPYYTMPIMTGGTLAQRAERFRDPRRAAALMIKIARAVQHAHRHGVLHRDLSPSNVLLDHDDEPFVTDFMAKPIGEGGPSTQVGKFNYVAPEQAAGQGASVEADIYGLGAIFFDLLTTHAPLEAKSFDEVVAKHNAKELKPPRHWVPDLSPELDAVCWAALQTDPRKRHRSAGSFADSLERVLADLPPLWPETKPRRRAWLWARRQPLLAAGAVLGALLLVVADVGTIESARSEQHELETATLHKNAALASAQARVVLALFGKFANQAARAATHPDVLEFMKQGAVSNRLPALQRISEASRSFDSVSVFSLDGRILARYPDPGPGFLGREFAFRRYHHCVTALIEQHAGAPPDDDPEVCISPAYRGEASANIEFTFASPVYDADGTAYGYITLNRHGRRTLDDMDIDDPYVSGQTTALFGLRGGDRHSPPIDEAAPPKLTVVAHPGLFNSEEYALEPELAKRIVARYGGETIPGRELVLQLSRPVEDANYVDPITGDTRLAGFAPVGSTGFVVAVSTPRSQALGTHERHRDARTRYAAMLNLGFLLLGVVAVWGTLKESRTPPGRNR
jgi:hypothetical protein